MPCIMVSASMQGRSGPAISVVETYAMVTTVSGPSAESSRAFRLAASWARMVVFVRAPWIAENTARVPRPGMPAVHQALMYWFGSEKPH